MAESANVAKFNLGGSGSNIVADGYIKAVEKIWLDSYTIAFTNTNTTIDIAILPANKKVVSIELVIYSTISQTNGTVSIGFSTDANIDTFMAASTVTHNLTRSAISLPYQGFLMASGPATVTSGTNVVTAVAALGGIQKVTTGTQTTISVKLNNWTMTTGTIYSIVRYT